MTESMHDHASRPLICQAQPRRWSAIWFGMLLLLAVGPAYADNVVSGIAAASEHIANILLTLLVFNVAAWFIEAGILSRFLRLGYWKLFGLSVLVNVVSTVLGLWVWPFVLDESGWKTAIALGDLDRLAVLFVRSLALTVAEEALILMLLLRRRVKVIIIGVVVANLATYALAALLMVCVR